MPGAVALACLRGAGSLLVISRRSQIVLVVLLGAMTLTSVLLFSLEPGPMFAGAALPLQSVAADLPSPESLLFAPLPAGQANWQGVRVCFPVPPHTLASMAPSASGYHFLIHDGGSGPDGQIEITPAWRQQADGAADAQIWVAVTGSSARGPTADQIRELIWLVNQLQRRLQIPAPQVRLDLPVGDPAQTHFPTGRFRQQLLVHAPW